MLRRRSADGNVTPSRRRALGPCGALAALALGCAGERSDSHSVEVVRSPEQAAIAQAEPDASDTERRRFETIAAAVDFIEPRVDVPVEVPSNLPRGTTPEGVHLSDGSAQLSLRLPDGEVLKIRYGDAGLDGCGGERAREITLRGRPAVLNAIRLTTNERHTDLIWPATKRTLRGRYGLSGSLPPSRILSLARAMRPVRAAAPRGAFRGC